MNNEVRLILTPHMDDEVIGMGGTIANLVKSGYQVVVVYLTDGAAAYEGNVSETKQYFSKRKSEAEEALGVLGCASGRLAFLRFPDAKLAEYAPPHEGKVLKSVYCVIVGGLSG